MQVYFKIFSVSDAKQLIKYPKFWEQIFTCYLVHFLVKVKENSNRKKKQAANLAIIFNTIYKCDCLKTWKTFEFYESVNQIWYKKKIFCSPGSDFVFESDCKLIYYGKKRILILYEYNHYITHIRKTASF